MARLPRAIVTFACDCAQSHLEALIERASDGAEAARLFFEQSGKQSVELPGGSYDVAYRAQGTPRTPFSLKTTGGSMRAVDRVMPAEGEAAGVRRLLVVVRLVVIPLALGWAPPDRALAQAPDAPGEQRKQAERALATIPNISEVIQPGYFLALEAGSGSKAGTATIAVENGSGSFATSVSLSGPLDESSKAALPRTLTGLPNSSVVGLALHWFRWPGRPDSAAMRRLCQENVQHEDCDDDELATPAARHAFVRLAHSGNAPIVVGLHGSLGREAFSYLDRTTLRHGSETHTTWAAGIAAGRFTPGVGYIAVEYEHQQRFHAGESTDLCEAIATGAVSCRSVVLGHPGAQRLDIGRIEWRFFFGGGRVAINPSASRDFRRDISAIDLPLYFLALSSGGLAGGARATWRSDAKDLGLAFFVGTALHPTP